WLNAVIVDGMRRGSNRVPSAENLSRIGMAILIYAQDHQGMTPSSLDELVVTTGLERKVLICPNGGSYQYFAPNPRNSDLTGDIAIAMDHPAANPEGANVLFGDGHVEWVTQGQLASLLKPSTQPAPSTSAPSSSSESKAK